VEEALHGTPWAITVDGPNLAARVRGLVASAAAMVAENKPRQVDPGPAQEGALGKLAAVQALLGRLFGPWRATAEGRDRWARYGAIPKCWTSHQISASCGPDGWSGEVLVEEDGEHRVAANCGPYPDLESAQRAADRWARTLGIVLADDPMGAGGAEDVLGAVAELVCSEKPYDWGEF
jgi:hypothetical protein